MINALDRSVRRSGRTRSRRLATASLVALVALPFAGIATGGRALAAAGGGKGAPTPSPVAAPAERCTLRDPNKSANDEWAKCVTVQATLDRAPSVGESAVLTVSVTSQIDVSNARIEVDVPSAAMRIAGSGASVAAARARDGATSVNRATQSVALAKAGVRVAKYTIDATAASAAQIRVRVIAPRSADRVDAAADDVFVTVGKTASASRLGVVTDASKPGATAPIGAGARLVAGPHDAGAPLAPPDGPKPSSDDPVENVPQAPNGQACVFGGWFFTNHLGNTTRAANETVQVWDQDTFSGDDLLAQGVIGFDGRYGFCVNNDDGDLFDDSTQEIYVRFATTNTVWRVRDTPGGNNTYLFDTGVWDSCNTCDHEFGNLQPANNAVMRGLNAFNSMNDFWLWGHGANNCFDRNDGSCRQMTTNWTSTSTDGTYYSPSGNDIHLAADDPNAPHTTVHEAAHAAMDDVYDDVTFDRPNCNPHSIQSDSSTGCAWSEGFAEWVPASVFNDPFYRWPDGASLNLETPTWGTFGWDSGDDLEGRVAGAMIDISDAANEQYWDYANEGEPTNQWTTFQNTFSANFAEFFLVDRPAQGFSTNDFYRGSVYQNTIDYEFRDPLFNYGQLVRPTPNPAQNYGFLTTTNYWSAVAVRSASVTTDYDLRVYDDRGLFSNVGSSVLVDPATDFVAIDSNRRAFGDYYPRVNQFDGTGTYNIELAQGSDQANDGAQIVSLVSSDVVVVRDTLMTAGVPTYFRVVPSGTSDLTMHLMRSDVGNSATWVQGRAAAVRLSNSKPAGGDESFNYTESATQFDGLVVTQKSGSGTFTIYRDTTAPNATMTIGAGNPPKTNVRNVTLVNAASDVNTGIKDMRVSLDGTLDTEVFEAYAASKAVTLPAGDGVKTVKVEFRNQALMSTVVTDTITLDSRPNLKVTVLGNPPAATQRGAAFGVSDTTKNVGSTGAGASTTRYYLSLNGAKDALDTLLAGPRAIPALAAGAQSAGARAVTVPATMPAGQYFLIGCADDLVAVVEYSETDNCKASATKVTVQVPDYVVTVLANPPGSRARGATFPENDTTKNNGTLGTATVSRTRFYLSVDQVKDPLDRLIGNRSVPGLAAGAINAAASVLTVPATMPVGQFFVIACSDDLVQIAESNEANNCKASTTRLTVT